MKFFTIGLLFLSLMTLTACFKEGPKGADGADGNANVIGTNEVVISNWTQTGSVWSAGISVPSITQDIVNTGVVQVFVKYGSQWWALPDINGNNMTYFGYEVGHISLLNSNTDNSTPSHPGSPTFRVVAISSSNIAANPGVDWKDFKQVKEVLELKD
jgi:hypothetical protein